MFALKGPWHVILDFNPIVIPFYEMGTVLYPIFIPWKFLFNPDFSYYLMRMLQQSVATVFEKFSKEIVSPSHFVVFLVLILLLISSSVGSDTCAFAWYGCFYLYSSSLSFHSTSKWFARLSSIPSLLLVAEPSLSVQAVILGNYLI